MNTKLLLAAAVAAIVSFSCTRSGKADVENYSPVEGRIMSRWAAEVSPANAHPEYPRPQLVRKEWKSLNGMWDYAIVPATSSVDEISYEGKILVPFAIESALSGVGKHVPDTCKLVYHTVFEVPGDWDYKTVLLHFDAVDWAAGIRVNGEYVSEHTGGYVPFSVDVSAYLHKGKNDLVVEVLDGTDNKKQPRGKQVSRPHGIWYTSVTGIWQSVWMEPVSVSYLDSYYCIPSLADGSVTVYPKLEGEGEVTVELCSGAVGFDPLKMKPGKVLADGVVKDGSVKLSLGNVEKWTPDNPYLYALRFTVTKDGKKVDSAVGYTTFREIGTKVDKNGFKRLALNGEPLFQYGPLDQGWWPDGLYTAPTLDAMKYDIEKTRDFGYNMIRKHIKVEPSSWYYWCDRLGIMVWQDMPSITNNKEQKWDQNAPYGGTEWDAPEEVRKTYYKEWGEIIDHLRTFNCIVVWVPFNEAWGQFETAKVVDFTKEKDSSRLVNAASGGNFFDEVGDILDSHHYPNPQMRLWAKTLVNVLGEYGGIGLPLEGHLWQPDKNWGYVQYKNGEEVLQTYVAYTDELIGEVKKGCSAAVYTQTTDVEIEINGLMTYDREVIKMDEQKLAEANRRVIASMTE